MSNNGDNGDWEKAYWSKRQQQLNNLHQRPQQTQTPGHTPINNGSGGGWRDVDVNEFVQQRMLQQVGQSQIPNSNSKVVFLREGYEHFTGVDGASGFGSTVPMVKSLGKLQTNIQGRQFVLKGEVSAYCIDNLSSVDLSKINEHPERKLTLVRVAENLFSREILVPRSAIVENSNRHNGQEILKG